MKSIAELATEAPQHVGGGGSPVRMIANLRLLWSQRRLLFRVTVLSIIVTTGIAFLLPRRYDSTVRLMPPDDQPGAGMAMVAALAGKLNGGLAGIAGNVLGLKSSGDLFIGVLRSRTVQDRLISKFDLKRIYSTNTWEATRRILSQNTAVSEDRKSGIITITVTAASPKQAAEMAQAYATELDEVVSHLSTSSAHRERVFLEERLAQVKQDLSAAEKNFSEFSSRNGAIDIKEQGRAMVGAAANLQGELIAAESELGGLRQIYADSNVRIRSLQARIVELRSQLQKLGGKEQIGKDIFESGDKSLYPSIRQLPLLGVPYADLYRQTKVQEAVFETLTQEYELAKVAEAREVPTVKVLDPADIPERKSFPPRLAIIGLGAFLGFASAVLFVLWRGRWQALDPRTPFKELMLEITHTVEASAPWSTPNGSRPQGASHRFWSRFRRPGRMQNDNNAPRNCLPEPFGH